MRVDWFVFLTSTGVALLSASPKARAEGVGSTPAALTVSVAPTGGQPVFKVSEGDNLTTISIQLFGKASDWTKIAEWNGLQAPYRLKIGQELVVRDPNVLPPSVGKVRLLRFWRRLLDAREEEIVRREEAGEEHPWEIEERKRQRAEYDRALLAIAGTYDPGEEKSAQLFHDGKRFYDQKDYAKALELFRASRKEDKDAFVSWIYEILTLRVLEREDEEREVVQSLLVEHPEYSQLPIFRKLATDQGSAKPDSGEQKERR